MPPDSRSVERVWRLYNSFAKRPAAPLAAFKVRQGTRCFLSRPSMLAIANPIVLSGEWIVIKNDLIYCDSFMQTPQPPFSVYVIHRVSAIMDVLHEAPKDLPVEKAFLLGGCTNYAHWLIDFLPRLALCRDKAVPLLVHEAISPVQLECLGLLDIDPQRLVRLEYPGAYRIKVLQHPSTGSSQHLPSHPLRANVINWLRDAFTPLISPGRRHRRIFISRAAESADHRRRLVNHDEIVDLAKAHDFEIVACEALSFAEQMRLFAEAAVIAGPHGAGFANMVFAPKEARVIELIGPEFAASELSTAWRRIATILGQKFTRVVGRSDPETQIAFGFLPYETYRIDPKDFVDAVQLA